jgi:hypothetical protein
LANEIFMVTWLLSAIFAISAFSMLMRCTTGSFRPDLAGYFFQRIPGALVEFADKIEVGIEEVADDATEGDEFRAVTKSEVLAALLAGRGLQDGKQAMPCGAGKDGASEDDDVIAIRVQLWIALR